MKVLFEGRFGREVRFIAVGLWNTFLGYFIFLLFNAWLSRIFTVRAWAYMLATIISNILAVINAFIFHKNITFRSRAVGYEMVGEFFRFSLTYLFSFILSLLLMPVLVEICHIVPSVSALIVILVCTVVSYIGHVRFSFKQINQP